MLSVHGSTSVAAVSDSTTISDFFCKDERIVRVGDCALFKPTLDSLPLIGIIRQIVEPKKENIRLAVNWIYRPTGLELRKGVLLKAAPNEVFFSFHKDEIPAASLLHPCKVAFLCKGVELPSRIASFVCKRVYDIENKCLWWLTDKHYNKEQKEELHKLLDKTRLEMHGAMQSGGRSPKPLNVQTSNAQSKPGPDSVKNNDSFSPVVKGKKRECGDSGSDLIKEDRVSKPSVEDEGSDNMLRSQIGKITERGGLVEFEGVRKLVQLMHPEGAEMKIDLVGRTMLADVISVTDNFECLGRFVQLRGLPLLDEWLQEVRRGKFGSKESDKSVDEFLLAVLRALEKLPVNLYSLQTSNVGKSVNYLRSHRNPEIQKKARSLVDTWKKRVKAEMNVIDAKSGLNRAVSPPPKAVSLEVSHVGVSRTGGSSDAVVKSSIQQPSAPKSPGVNISPGDAVSKLPIACPGSSNKLSGGTSLHRKSSNETSGSASFGVQKELEKHQKVSPNGSKQLKLSDTSLMDHGLNQRLIVRLPNTGRSPARCVSEGSVEEPAVVGKASSSPSQSESHEHHNRNSKVKSLSERDNYIINAELCQSKDCVAEIDNFSPSAAVPHDEQRSASENYEILQEATKTILSSKNAAESGKSFEPSFSSINALIDSCVKFSEVSASALLGDDVGMNLLASVAAGEISKSDSSSPLRSGRNSPAVEDPCSGSEAKLKKPVGNVARVKGQTIVSSMNEAILEKSNSALSSVEKTENECGAHAKPADNSCSVPEGNHSEVTYDASVPLSSIHDAKEYTEDEGSNYKTNIGQREGSKSSLEEDEKINQADDSVLKNCMVAVVEAATKYVKVELKNPVDNEQSFRKQRQLESEDGNNKADLRSYSGVSLKAESLDEKANTVKTELLIKQEEKPNEDSVTVTQNDGESSIFCSATHKVLKEISVQEPEGRLKISGCKSDEVESDETDERHASSVNTSSASAAGSEKALKLDFDLNEGFPADDDSQEQHQNLPALESSSAVHLSCPFPFPISSMSGSFPTSITVAAAAKGPFVHPEHLSSIKGELGWKGSAATSAFRPAEPRKILELPLNTSATLNVDGTASKHTRAPLDIDLNVSDERGLDDVVSPYSTKRLCTELRPCNHSAGPAGRLDFDLNSVGECPDALQFSVNNISKLENISLLSRSSLTGGFSNGEMSMSRNFDLNNGPGIDEVATETAPLRQNTRSNAPILSPIPAMTMNHTELGNMASWFSPVNSHLPITIPSFYSSRGEQCYPVVTAAGPQRILVPSVNGNNTSFGSEMFRGAVLQSSPAVVFPPTSTFSYPGYPFETSFPVASNHYMDSSSGGAICFPAISSQLEGSTNVVPSHYPQPFLMGLPGSTASIGHESRKWGNQGLDLNAGPGSSDIPPAYRHISVGSPAQVNKQLHMYQMAGGGLKRKEPDGGRDIESDRYKHL